MLAKDPERIHKCRASLSASVSIPTDDAFLSPTGVKCNGQTGHIHHQSTFPDGKFDRYKIKDNRTSAQCMDSSD